MISCAMIAVGITMIVHSDENANGRILIGGLVVSALGVISAAIDIYGVFR